MDLEKIKYFIKVCETKNLTRAADELYISQPTLSRHILALESELGITLLTRKRSGVELTEAGKIFFEDALKFQKAKENLTNNIYNYKHHYSGNINFGIDQSTELLVAYYTVNAFKKQSPNINIRTQVMTAQELNEHFLNGTIDIAYSYRNSFPDVCGSAMTTLIRNYPTLKVPQGHKLYERSKIMVQDFMEEILFIPSKRNDPLAEATLQALEQNNIRMENTVFFDNWYNCYFQAAMDCRLSIGGRFGFEKNLDLNPLFRHYPLIELDVKSADLCAIYRAENPLAQSFAQQLQGIAQKHNDHYLRI